jgi:hypothetical protein
MALRVAAMFAVAAFISCPGTLDGDAGNKDVENEDNTDKLINSVNLTEYVPAPIMGNVPVTGFSAANYTGTVVWRETGTEEWSVNMPIEVFQPNKSYTSAVTLNSSSGNIFSASVSVIHEQVDTAPAPFIGISDPCASVSGPVIFPPYIPPHIPFSGAAADQWDSAIDLIRAAKKDGLPSLTLRLGPGIEAVSGDFATDFGGEGLFLNSENSPAEVIIDGRGRIIKLIEAVSVPVIIVDAGVKLTLRNITFEGIEDNNHSLILVNGSGAELILETGAVLKANSISGKGGGLYVGSGGVFTMKGGAISGNNARLWGGGVYVEDGAFTMKGGTISGNNASLWGGGVYVEDRGVFTMDAGIISGNSASFWGGGVYVEDRGVFIVKGGTISGNNADVDGRDVYIKDASAHTMEDGAIRDY